VREIEQRKWWVCTGLAEVGLMWYWCLQGQLTMNSIYLVIFQGASSFQQQANALLRQRGIVQVGHRLEGLLKLPISQCICLLLI
jgi:hypothetical protein